MVPTSSLPVFCEDLGNLSRFHLPVNLTVNCQNRRKSTATNAAHRLERKFAIFCCVVDADSQKVLELLDKVARTLQVAGRSHANRDMVLPWFFEFEEMVEGDDTVDLRKRHIE